MTRTSVQIHTLGFPRMGAQRELKFALERHWRGAAVDLASHDAIAVYPVGGWWKSHVGQRRMNDKARYALIISLSAPGLDVDLHADITAKVDAKVLEIAAAQIEAAPGHE